MASATTELRLGTASGRWVVVAMVLGSAANFVNLSVVNIALPAIGDDLDADLADLQWVANAYLLPLAALMLVGGSLGDVYGRRRVYLIGGVVFAAGSIVSVIAPTLEVLLVGRVVQGVGAAAMTPTSLAIVDASFRYEDRSAAVGAWASGTAVATAAGPFLGGVLVDALSWRWVFVLALPLVGASLLATTLQVPDVKADVKADVTPRRLDVAGAVLSTVALVGIVYALVQGPAVGWSHASVVTLLVAGIAAAVGFVVREARAPDPLLPLGVFRSRQFSGANAVTLLVYFALSGVFFFTAIAFQNGLGYEAWEAGAALVPSNVVMIAASPSVGRFAGVHGPRAPVAVGSLLTGASFVMLATLDEGSSYVTSILPASLVMGAGLAVLVPPLTSSVLGAVTEQNVGLASAVNNAVARTGGLLATAMLPGIAGVSGAITLDSGYQRGLTVSAGLCAVGAVVAYATVGHGVPTHTSQSPSVLAGCAQVSVPAGARESPSR